MKGFLKVCLKFIAVIAVIYGAYRLYEWIRYAPSRNPHPKYTMTVEGKIDPTLQGDVRLKLMTTYYTTNSECSYSVNWLEGISMYRTRIDTIIARPKADGTYRYAILLDKFLPGRCGWKIGNVRYQIFQKNKMLGNWETMFSPETIASIPNSAMQPDVAKDVIQYSENGGEGRLEHVSAQKFSSHLDGGLYRQRDYQYFLSLQKGAKK